MQLAYFLLFSHVAVYSQFLQLHFRDLGYSNAEVGLLMGILQVSGVVGALLMGRIVDRRPITRTLLGIGSAGSAVMLVFLGLAPGILSAAAIAVMMGVLFRSQIPLLDTHMSLLLSTSGRDYGRIRVWGTIGFVVSSMVFQLLRYPRPEIEGSIVTTFLIVSALFLVSVVLLPRPQVPTEAHAATEGGDGRLPRAFWFVLAISFLSNSGFAVHSSFFSLYLQDMFPGFLVSGAWALGAIAEIPAMLLGGLAVRRFGVGALFVSAAAAMALRLLVYALVPQTVPVLAAQLLHAFSFGALHTAAMYFISRAIPGGVRGRAVSLYNAFGFGLPGLLGGILGGQILQQFGFSVLFLVFVIPPALAALVALASGSTLESAIRTRAAERVHP